MDSQMAVQPNGVYFLPVACNPGPRCQSYQCDKQLLLCINCPSDSFFNASFRMTLRIYSFSAEWHCRMACQQPTHLRPDGTISYLLCDRTNIFGGYGKENSHSCMSRISEWKSPSEIPCSVFYCIQLNALALAVILYIY